MDDRPIIWDAANRKHLADDHPERRITLDEVEQVMTNAGRVELYQANRRATLAVGRTRAGRWVVVAWIDHPDGRYPIHARAAGRRLIRRLTS